MEKTNTLFKIDYDYIPNHTCPMCGSSDTAAQFSVDIANIHDNIATAISYCKKCNFQVNYGEFERLNLINNRNNKIEDILDGIS